RDLREDVIRLMRTALEAGNALAEGSEQYVISGERNLFAVRDLSQDVDRLKKLVELLEQKTSLLHILDLSLRGQGVQVFIGGESGVQAPDDVSVVTSPYKVDGEVVGTVGVIGPTRMAYDRVVPIVDITAKLVSSARSQHQGRALTMPRSSRSPGRSARPIHSKIAISAVPIEQPAARRRSRATSRSLSRREPTASATRSGW